MQKILKDSTNRNLAERLWSSQDGNLATDDGKPKEKENNMTILEVKQVTFARIEEIAKQMKRCPKGSNSMLYYEGRLHETEWMAINVLGMDADKIYQLEEFIIEGGSDND